MIEIRMPHLGEGVTEGTIVRWLKAEGDTVAEGETLAEIMTDKVNVEFESPAAGIAESSTFLRRRSSRWAPSSFFWSPVSVRPWLIHEVFACDRWGCDGILPGWG